MYKVKGTIKTGKNKIIQRWCEYFGELFHNKRETPIHKNIDGMGKLKSEVRSILDNLNKKKVAGPNEILIEILTALDDFHINKIMKNNKWNIQQ